MEYVVDRNGRCPGELRQYSGASKAAEPHEMVSDGSECHFLPVRMSRMVEVA